MANLPSESEVLGTCADGLGVEYMITRTRRRPLGPNGEVSVVAVMMRPGKAARFEPLPMRVHWRSRLRYPLAAFPPEALREYRPLRSGLLLRFWDPWIAYERPWFPRESEWESILEPRLRRWILRRLRFLDYEGGGDHPGSADKLVTPDGGS